MTPGDFRLRVRYRKAGRLRWLSHLEVVHSLERTIRRAELPFAVTQGFSPHLKAAFGPALPVGTAGENEYLDIWLTRYTEATKAVEALAAASPDDLAPLEGRYVGARVASLTAALTIAKYHIELDGEELVAEEFQEALAGLVSTGEFEIEHKGKRKVYDLTRCVPEDARVNVRDGGVNMELTIRMGPEGALRPERLIRAALDTAGLTASSVRTTRRDTLVENEGGIWSRPM